MTEALQNKNNELYVFLEHLFTWFHKVSTFWKYSAIISVTIALGVLDAVTGYEFGFSFFYLLPVAMTSWFIGFKPGLAISLACGLIWGGIDIYSGHVYSNMLFVVWNSIMRMGFYSVTVLLLESVHTALRNERVLSQTDFLTGLYNRRFIYECLHRTILMSQRSKEKAVFAYIDLDHFKSVNDTLGHQEGDKVLQSLAKTMQANLRRTDWIGRIGGDEFIILLTHTDLEHGKDVLSNLNKKILQEMQNNNWPITLSIGALEINDNHTSVDEVIGASDKLMYAVKTNGKNSLYCKAS